MKRVARTLAFVVSLLASVSVTVAHAATLAGGSRFTVLAKPDGTVWTWGQNQEGQLGDGSTTNRTTPAQVPGLTDVVAVAAGGHFVLALKSDGTVWAWGHNGSGQLGDGTTTRAPVPSPCRCPASWQSPRGTITPSRCSRTARCGRGATTATGSWDSATRRIPTCLWPPRDSVPAPRSVRASITRSS